MIDYKELDKKIQHGYVLVLEKHEFEGCNEWLQAWEDIKQLMKETNSKDVYELDDKFTWSGPPSELLEDMKYELKAAGAKDQDYQLKYNAFCQESASYIGDGKPIERNRRFIQKNGLYVQEISDFELANYFVKKEPAPFIKQEKIGRNEPCPCGSSKKYKKCCGVKMVV